MSAAEALKAARAAGIRVGIDGDDLMLAASAPPPPAVLDLLSRHKAGIVTLLRPAEDGWSAEDWHVFFDERAGIAEFDGKLPRGQAEARAFACCAEEWLNRNPVRVPVAAIMATIRSCIRAAGPPGTPAGKPRPSRRCRRWGSRRLPTCQTISEKTGARDGRLGIRPACGPRPG